MLFGSRSDLDLFIRINRELLRDVIEQEILYYKISLSGTNGNIYGESLEKTYMIPSKLNCLVTRGDQVVSVDEFGPDLNRDFSFAFLRDDLVDIEVVPEIGDVIEWHNDFYLRRVRVGKNEAIYSYLSINHPELVEDEYFRPHDTAVIGVPQKAPDGAIMRTESPLQLLEELFRLNVSKVPALLLLMLLLLLVVLLLMLVVLLSEALLLLYQLKLFFGDI
jgi:hypothetical protein